MHILNLFPQNLLCITLLIWHLDFLWKHHCLYLLPGIYSVSFPISFNKVLSLSTLLKVPILTPHTQSQHFSRSSISVPLPANSFTVSCQKVAQSVLNCFWLYLFPTDSFPLWMLYPPSWNSLPPSTVSLLVNALSHPSLKLISLVSL